MVTPKNILIQDLELADKEIKRLREENRKLKEKLSEITMVADDEKQSIEHILELEQENRKLKDIEAELLKEKKELLDKVKQLEERLDNKEKVNISLREEIKELNKMMLFETKIEQDKNRFIRDRQTWWTLCI